MRPHRQARPPARARRGRPDRSHHRGLRREDRAGGRGVRPGGGEYGERSAVALKPGGLLVGALGSNLGITRERAADLGVRLAVVSVRPSAADLSRLTALVESGRLRVHLDQVLPLAEVAKAHELLSTRRTTGKIVLIP
ncbi:zinc-binding dehydrogenase [Streptosporangium vulgare]|uniref:zinc-binding dehydrogenase n=1 Tax=Streptosporangium vulgare TaxID=46190 RepID=UPI0031CDE229